MSSWQQVAETGKTPPKAGNKQVRVILFRLSGKYYTEENWTMPDGALTPSDMIRSPDFRRIDRGKVLICTQEPWGYPHLL